MAVERQDIMLLIADGARGQFPLDPIRLMKGCFVVSQVGPDEWKRLFDFGPYSYGPFDSSVYRARDALIAKGLLGATPVGRYSEYRITPEGRQRAEMLAGEVDPSLAAWLRNIGNWVTSKSFNDLLREIYDRFPEFATRSIARL